VDRARGSALQQRGPRQLVIDGAVGGDHVQNMVPEGHDPVGDGHTTAIPSDAFTVGDTMYMHLMRGVIYESSHSELWSSKDNGNTWEKICHWPADLLGSNFQQKTYAIGADNYAYVISGIFNREPVSDLLLHRVPLDKLGEEPAYEPWGWDGSKWGWGNPATTVARPRNWGEICFRALEGKYVLSYFDASAGQITAQVIDGPTGDLFAAPEQLLIKGSTVDEGNQLRAPYGGWVIPGSTFADFHVVVSQWFGGMDSSDYRVIQFKFSGVES
jgi:Domain of unknown function (DUF4185)